MYLSQWFIKTFFKGFSKILLFGPINGPYWGQPLDLNRSEFLFPRYASYKMWLKYSVVLQKRTLKGKVDTILTDSMDRHCAIPEDHLVLWA